MNYNGASDLQEYIYANNEYEYGDYDNSYGEYGDAKILVYNLTALHLAATEGNYEMVAKLLTVPGIIVDAETSEGATPLWTASSKGFTKIIEILHAA